MEERVQEIIKLEPQDYSILKLAEELAELSDAAIKHLTKPTGAFESSRLNHLIEEMADVKLRIDIVSAHLNLTNEVKARKRWKAGKILDACIQRYKEGVTLV